MSDLQSGNEAPSEAVPEATAPNAVLAELEQKLTARYGQPLECRRSEEMTEEELREAYNLMRYSLIRVIEVASAESAGLDDAHWADLCRDAQVAAGLVREQVDSFPQAAPFVSAGPDWRPDWVLLGGPNFGAGDSVFILHSTALTGAEMKRESKGLQRVEFAGRVARIPKVETTIRVQLSEFGQIYGADYPEALASIMDLWNRNGSPRPAAIEDGSGV